MLFNSSIFLIFLPIVFFIYWIIFSKKVKLRNIYLIVCSYIFYGWWDWRFLFLIAFSSLADYILGIKIFFSKSQKFKKIYLVISLVINLGILGLFKYFNFFTTSLADLLENFGFTLNWFTMQIILPVGISFYTFQTLSYSIDIYNSKIKPTRDIFAFFAFVSFFPQLVAGPIERARNLLPQFIILRKITNANILFGIRQIVWGFFKKVVIADLAAIYVNYIFNNYDKLSSFTLILGSIFFALQIYGDFSGYSDIAIGTARLFGFKLMQNFRTPYFAIGIKDFWKRWHISLSSWFKDYVYIPLGGNRKSKVRNIFIVFMVSGLWHGANWTFVIWGAVHAIFYYIESIMKKYITITDKYQLSRYLSIIYTFSIVTFAWIFFRAPDVSVAFHYISNIFTEPYIPLKNEFWNIFHLGDLSLFTYSICVSILISIEWINKNKRHEVDFLNKQIFLNQLFNVALLIIIILFGAFNRSEFIYFQF